MRPIVGARSECGFTLAEVLVSAGLLATVAAGASHLVARAVQDGEAARVRTVASVSALQKMEQLRSLAWHDEVDVVTSLAAEHAGSGGPGLQPSPAGTLDANVTAYVDYLSADGTWVAPDARGQAMFARRWAVETLDDTPDVLVLRVVVTRARGPMSRTSTGPGPFDVQLVSLRSRYQP